MIIFIVFLCIMFLCAVGVISTSSGNTNVMPVVVIICVIVVVASTLIGVTQGPDSQIYNWLFYGKV